MVVKLGDLKFDPIESQDFRLNIEGASKTGKSNSLAVILEDLKGVSIPTLVIERLNILSSVRQIDEEMIVIGGEESEGIDLFIPIKNLDIAVDLMFDENLKIILDISTYQEAEEDYHTEHKAVAKVLQELDKRSQENLRAGNRKKSLVVCDEVHYLAPENNSPIIDTSDKYVKRARSYLVKLFTEGGNKGVNMVVAYQRRSYTSKGIVSQADNFITHRLHKTDRSDISKEIGVDEEEIKNLSQGEIIAYGDITQQRLIGPTKVRKRTTPDPREQQFQLPERSGNIDEAIQGIQEKISSERQKKKEELSKIEKLENKLEQKERQIEKLKDNREIQEKLAKALRGFESSGYSPEVKEELEELEDIREENAKLNKQINTLREENDQYEEELREKDEKIEDLKAEKSELKQLDMVKEDIISDSRSILRKLGADSPDKEEAREEIEELKQKIQDQEKTIEKLKKKKKGNDNLDDEFTKEEDFLCNDRVQREVQKAMENNRNKNEHAWSILYILAEKGKAQIDEIEPYVDISRSSIGNILPALKKHNIVRKNKSGHQNYYMIDIDSLKDIIRMQRKREQMSEEIEKLKSRVEGG